MKTSPGRQNQHPVFTFPQGLQKGSNANVDISAKVEPFGGLTSYKRYLGRTKEWMMMSSHCFWEGIEAFTCFSFLPYDPVLKLLGRKLFLFLSLWHLEGEEVWEVRAVCAAGAGGATRVSWRGSTRQEPFLQRVKE